MSIRISNTSIHFGNFTLTANTEGFSFDGKIRAKRGFVDSSVPTVIGKISGYTVGGTDPTGPNTRLSEIQKYPFSSDNNATSVGDLSVAKYAGGSQSSKTSGYFTGGQNPDLPTSIQGTIDKFPFFTDTDSTDIGDLFQARTNTVGASSDVSGYTMGGATPPFVDTIDKFPFTTDTNASDVANLSLARAQGTSVSSRTHGYHLSGATVASAPTSEPVGSIEKFSFVTEGNSTDVADIVPASGTGVRLLSACNSEVNGYQNGGLDPGTTVNDIEKFPFSSESNSTDVGNLSAASAQTNASSSDNSGYVAGPLASGDSIEKYPFATDNNTTDVGDLTRSVTSAVGNQN